jgi:carboxylesterase
MNLFLYDICQACWSQPDNGFHQQSNRRVAMAKQKLGVLILHGFTSSLDCVSAIETRLKVLDLPTRMPVLRGHGADSPEALRGVTWHDWVADGEAALQALLTEAEKVIIFGHSMGGLVALTLAAENEHSVDSIVLAAAAVQLVSPLAPGRPFHFLMPLVHIFVKKWDLPPDYADPHLAQFDTNYRWTPIDTALAFVEFSEVTGRRLAEVRVPTLIMQSRKDTTVAPESANIIYNGISTPLEQKRIVWFMVTEHEMFRDCERETTIETVVQYVRERVGLTQ